MRKLNGLRYRSATATGGRFLASVRLDVNMPIFPVLLIAIAVSVLSFAAPRLLDAWLKYRGAMVITCPENQKPASVSLDARHAAATSFSGAPNFRLSNCSRWPERAGCGQECLRQIEKSPESYLVRKILARWYAGKNCVWCRRPIADIHLAERKPTLLLANQVSLEWAEIQAERLQETLDTAQPLCFSCHVANTMVREYPELVIDRSRPIITGTSRGAAHSLNSR